MVQQLEPTLIRDNAVPQALQFIVPSNHEEQNMKNDTPSTNAAVIEGMLGTSSKGNFMVTGRNTRCE
ncbi:hypothetical protein MTR67_029528 [Solanum verrucosum]|uniref:Uncharacterized protein n=1 Tax=Solanum verrucosum TaxID=315347 RepID=A0AAF0U0W2_SOLVR|nr:hypothetical protein MTR67_029528 [Solanum verrucosum]